MAWLIYTVITLGSATLWGSISGWLLYFYLPPGEQPLVPIAFYSVVILASKAVNILLGLPIGYLSDHTRSNWGRRLPYIIGGGIFLPVLFFFLWTPPSTTESNWNLLYLAAVLIAFSAAYEIHQIPYDFLLPELAVGEKDRVTISTWKTGFLLGEDRLDPPWGCSSRGWDLPPPWEFSPRLPPPSSYCRDSSCIHGSIMRHNPGKKFLFLRASERLLPIAHFKLSRFHGG